MKHIIYFYNEKEQPFGCFSNYSPHSVYVFGKKYKTSEHAFQSIKLINPNEQEIVSKVLYPNKAKEFGRRFLIRNDWEEIKDDIMYQIVKAKFMQHDDIKQILLNTNDAELIEHTKNDSYWADGGNGTGLNKLGKILMHVRDELSLY